MERTHCPLCDNNNCQKENHENTIFVCPDCGRFQMDCFSTNEVRLTSENKLILRHYYQSLPPRDEKRFIILDSRNLDDILGNIYYPKNLVEKVDNVLAYFVNKTKTFGRIIQISSKQELLTPLFCVSVEELNEIINYLIAEGYLTFPIKTLKSPEQYIVTMNGLKYYQEYEKRLLKDKNKSRQCFVAMCLMMKKILKDIDLICKKFTTQLLNLLLNQKESISQ